MLLACGGEESLACCIPADQCRIMIEYHLGGHFPVDGDKLLFDVVCTFPLLDSSMRLVGNFCFLIDPVMGLHIICFFVFVFVAFEFGVFSLL